jgi:hypothetical protein
MAPERKDSFEAAGGIVGAFGDDHHAALPRIGHADPVALRGAAQREAGRKKKGDRDVARRPSLPDAGPRS